MKTEEKLEMVRDEIRKLTKAIRKFRDGPLNEKAILVLLSNVTKLPQSTISKVLDGVEDLEDFFLKEVDDEESNS